MKTTTNPSTTDWREEFDYLFRTPGGRMYTNRSLPEEIKTFIESLLSRKEEEVLERNDDYQSGFDAGYEAAKKEWKSY